MSILQRLRSDLQRALHEHQAKALLHMIRERVGELTLGDLREILASKVGRGLEALRIVELTGGTGAAAPALPGKAKGAKAKPKAATTATATKAKGKGGAKGKAKAKRKAAGGSFGAELIEKVWQTLTSAGAAMTSGELRAALGGSKATMYRAVSELVREGKVQTAGKPARYSVKAEGEARQEAAAEAPAAAAGKKQGKKQGKKGAGKKGAGKKAAGKKAAGKQAGKKAGKQAATQGAGKRAAKAKSGEAAKPAAKAAEVSARTLDGRAEYDGRVIAALREAGDWVGATRVREKVGGSDNQLRIALHRLIADGKVARRGARNATEYRLGG